jgi:23S rRNA (cytidine1920-2'-O)/16S rRNA (cytidine1409-2'-O)-methyltransferase
MKSRLDQTLVEKGLVTSRSQAESFVRLGKVTVDGKVVEKPGFFVTDEAKLKVNQDEQYVSRAGMKLASVASNLGLDFTDKVVLDVGSSTGGFTDYSLRRGAKKVVAVDVGTDQLHPKLQGHKQIDLHEKTDIRDVSVNDERVVHLNKSPDIVLIDVSFISLREILPHINRHVAGKNTQVVAMLKPQFEAGLGQVNKGVIKNDSVRRQILKDFENWVRKDFIILDKRDSEVSGAKGNRERFYLLNKA